MLMTEPNTLPMNAVGKRLKIYNLFLLDKSSSMHTIRDSIITGFNEQLEDIQGLDKTQNVESFFGLVEFASNVTIRYLSQPVSAAEKLTRDNYAPSGCTALYDALVYSIKALENKLASELTEVKVLVTILTDGEDTASRHFQPTQAADLIKQFQEDYGWTFTFIGTEIDVESLARNLNVSASNTLSFAKCAAGTQYANDTLKMARSMYYSKSLNGEDTSKSFFHADK